MPTPVQHSQENLSQAYVQAVASGSGVICDWTNEDDYGIDGSFRLLGRKSGGGFFPNGSPLEFQLKASKNCARQNGRVSYDLDADTYNFLLEYKEDGGNICLLVYDMPDNEADWLDCNPSELILRTRCYYWIPSGEISENTSTQRVSFPATNTVMPGTLEGLVEKHTP
jgi:hypothetical protein